MTTHAMIDLETLGTGPDCVVLTIGGVKNQSNEVSNTCPMSSIIDLM